MARFIQYPIYISDSNPPDNYVYANGISSMESGSKCLLRFGTNTATHIGVAARIVGNYGVLSSSISYIYSESGSSSPSSGYAVSTEYLQTGVYYKNSAFYDFILPYGTNNLEAFASLDEAVNAFLAEFTPSDKRNIKVSANGCIVTCPSFVQIGTNVTAYVAPNPGATVTSENISITRGGSPIEFNYSNGVLTFTAS